MPSFDHAVDYYSCSEMEQNTCDLLTPANIVLTGLICFAVVLGYYFVINTTDR